MGFSKELDNLRGRIYQGYIDLIKQYGKDGELKTFEFCSDYGLRLYDRKIYKMVVAAYSIFFYYSDAEYDYTYFKSFEIEDLAQFYDGLVEAMDEEEKFTCFL